MGVLETFSLKDKVAIVTGGAGLYGRQVVEALAEAGATTIAASRNLQALETVASDFRQRGLNVSAHKLDQADEDSVRQLCQTMIDEHGRIDILVNNAVLRPMKPREFNPDAWRQSMTVNAAGLYMISEITAEHMKQQRSGSIINVGSIQGMIGIDLSLYEGLTLSGQVPDYFFHKGGMINYTRYLAGVLGPYNIRVNVVSPGGFFNNQPEEFVRRYSARTFLGRMANETDLKGTIVFLASDASAYITGANLPVDAGYTAK